MSSANAVEKDTFVTKKAVFYPMGFQNWMNKFGAPESFGSEEYSAKLGGHVIEITATQEAFDGLYPEDRVLEEGEDY